MFRELYKSDVVIVQGGAIRGDSEYDAGSQITRYDMWYGLQHVVCLIHFLFSREFPFPNVITMYKLKGCDLKQALEEGVRYLPYLAGCFPQVSGTFSLTCKTVIY